MRNPDRINQILTELRKLWQTYPDMRLGQLIEAAVPAEQTLFYLEDDDLIRLLHELDDKLTL